MKSIKSAYQSALEYNANSGQVCDTNKGIREKWLESKGVRLINSDHGYKDGNEWFVTSFGGRPSPGKDPLVPFLISYDGEVFTSGYRDIGLDWDSIALWKPDHEKLLEQYHSEWLKNQANEQQMNIGISKTFDTGFVSTASKLNLLPDIKNMKSLSAITTGDKTAELTMSSREIAEFTGKQHKHVKRDIRKMLTELELGESNFGRMYFDIQNRPQTEYHLSRKLTDCLLTGYNAKARMAVIERWHELEGKEQQSEKQLPTNFLEALKYLVESEEKLIIAAPKVAFVDNLVTKTTLMNATQVGQKHKMSAVKLNRFLDELGSVYNGTVKRSRVFKQSFINNGYGEMKQTEEGHSQALFTTAGEVWINEKLFSEGIV